MLGDSVVARTSSAKDISRILTLVAAVVVITALYFARVMLVPLALGVLFTFVLAPLVTALERIRIPRFFAIFLVVGIAVSGIGIMGWTVGNQLIDVTNQLPSYKTNIKEKIDAIRNPKNRRLDKAADAMKELGKEIAENPPVPEPGPSSLKNPGSGKAAAQQQSKTVPVQVFQPVSNPLESLKYKRVRVNVPNTKIIVGLWKFSGDPIKAAARFNIVGDDKLAITLAQAVLQVGVFQQIELVPEHASAGAMESK